MRLPPHDKHPFWTVLKELLRIIRIILETVLNNI